MLAVVGSLHCTEGWRHIDSALVIQADTIVSGAAVLRERPQCPTWYNKLSHEARRCM